MQRALHDHPLWQQHRLLDLLQSILLLGILAAFLALLGYLVWGPAGILLTIIGGCLLLAINPGKHPQWVMRAYRAQPLSEFEYPKVYQICKILSQRAALERVPTLYRVPSNKLNAFTIGHPKNAVIGISDGLLRQLSMREISGVLAHEISHIAHNDLWIMSLGDMLTRLTQLAAVSGQILLLVNLPLVLLAGVSLNWWAILFLIAAPTLSVLVQLALSRTREYSADESAAWLSADPLALAQALKKIEYANGSWWPQILLPKRFGLSSSLFRTHPETKKRVQRLEQLSQCIDSNERIALADKPEYWFRPFVHSFNRPYNFWHDWL